MPFMITASIASDEPSVANRRIAQLEERLAELRKSDDQWRRYSNAQSGCIASLEAQVAALQAVVEQVEWVWIWSNGKNAFVPACAYCRNFKTSGHADNCPRQVALGLTQKGGE